jgi:hypothetical protein
LHSRLAHLKSAWPEPLEIKKRKKIVTQFLFGNAWKAVTRRGFVRIPGQQKKPGAGARQATYSLKISPEVLISDHVIAAAIIDKVEGL